MITNHTGACMISTLYAVQTSLLHLYLNTANKSFISILFLKRHDKSVVLLQ